MRPAHHPYYQCRGNRQADPYADPGRVATVGDDSDTCLTSWLAGNTNASACAAGIASVLPGVSTTPANPLLQCLTQP